MLIESFIAAVLIGAFAGFWVCLVFVADPLRRSRNLLHRRIIEEQVRTYAAGSRLAAYRLLDRREREDNARHSLRVVR